MLILSIHSGHDSSVCIFNNGRVEKYFLVERFTRKKHDDEVKVILKLVDIICSKFSIDVLCISDLNPSQKDRFIPEIFEQCKKSNSNVKLVMQSDHHLNHASLAFYNSKFDESLVVVADGSGSTIKNNLVEVESVFIFNQEKSTLIYKNTVKKSSAFDLTWGKNNFGVGGLYDIAAVLIGNTPDDCGKAMGLSSYGSPNKLFENLFLQQNIDIKPIKKVEPNNYQLHADFCYEVQQQTQKVIGDLIEDSIQKTGIKKVCISGGYGMNIVANHYYLQRFPDVEFYFEPVCNDNGVSIGAAMNSYVQLTNQIPNPIKTTFFHGLNYDVSSYQGITTSIRDIAELLNKDKSVAVYTGLAEAGQRSLGNRSILFNALNPDAKDIVNRIKKREWYRPFACVVLEEDANIYFDMGKIKSSPFMTICFPVRQKYGKMIPGVTHVDNTCRIQTVSETDGYLYKLLQEFKTISGHGILLNTSFNLAGEPLVETPTNALDTLNTSSLDYLWFEETQQLYGKQTIT
jgi:carbamoyltransferase